SAAPFATPPTQIFATGQSLNGDIQLKRIRGEQDWFRQRRISDTDFYFQGWLEMFKIDYDEPKQNDGTQDFLGNEPEAGRERSSYICSLQLLLSRLFCFCHLITSSKKSKRAASEPVTADVKIEHTKRTSCSSHSCMRPRESVTRDRRAAGMSRGRSGLSAHPELLHSSGGLGVAGLAVTYARRRPWPSSLRWPPLVIGRLGGEARRRTMAACLLRLPACTWRGQPGTRIGGTIIPASVLGRQQRPALGCHVGLCCRLAGEYRDGPADTTAERRHSRVGQRQRCVGLLRVFFTMFASSNIWGNLISYLALSDWQQHPASALGSALRPTAFCSAGNADGDGASVERPPEYKLVDRTDSEARATRVTLAQLRGNILAMPAPHGGLAAAAACSLPDRQCRAQPVLPSSATSPSGFVACSSGICAVGRVMMCYGAGHVLGGALRLGGRPARQAAAGCCQIGLEVAGLLWQVEAEPVAYFYCYAFAWGCVDTVWNSQMNAIYGEYFSDRTDAAPFSAYRFFESLGYILGFSYNKCCCASTRSWASCWPRCQPAASCYGQRRGGQAGAEDAGWRPAVRRPPPDKCLLLSQVFCAQWLESDVTTACVGTRACARLVFKVTFSAIILNFSF
uniref:MFS domain-containing protein n=1 Tax=Macrostomum lignano TaxID=282301 RepID=A0A1I8FU76_9PLAT